MGIFIVENFLTKDEVTKLSKVAFGDTNILRHAFELNWKKLYA